MNSKKILVLDNHIINPPESGGPLRIYNLFESISGEFEVTYLGVTGWQYLSREKKRISKNFYEQTIPLSKAFILLNNFFHNILKSIPTFDISCSFLMFLSPNFMKTLKKEIKMADIIITSHPWFIRYIKNYKNKIKVYDSHNCEYLLYKSFFKENLLNRIFLNLIMRIEGMACRDTDIILACSKEDKYNLCKIYNINQSKIEIVPNPIDLKKYSFMSASKKKEIMETYNLQDRKTALFIGSHFLPNIEAFRFILNKLVPKIKDVVFLVVGDVSKAYEADMAKVYFKDLKNIPSLLGTGWFDIEKWGQEGFDVRWTRKEFNFLINEPDINEICVTYRSLKRIKGEIYLNDEKKGSLIFHTGIEFKKIKLPITSDVPVNICIKLNKSNKSLFFDTREVGIAISKILYLSKGIKKEINLKETIIPFTLPENLRLLGKISNKELYEILNISDIALNPVTHGSGLNIKMLDYMALNIPIISTKVGIRGLNLENNQNVVVCKLNEFHKKIKSLLKTKRSKRDSLPLRNIAENNYDLSILSQKLIKIFNSSLNKK